MTDLTRWDVAGFGGDDFWTDVESGDRDPIDLSDPGAYDAFTGATEYVFSYLDSDNEAHYYTIYDYELDFDTLDALLDDLEDAYGLG